MALFLLSLAGIPPTAGFIAKVGVFTAAIDAGHWRLALIGVLASVAAAFFYLRVIVADVHAGARRTTPTGVRPRWTGAILVSAGGRGRSSSACSRRSDRGIIRDASVLRW